MKASLCIEAIGYTESKQIARFGFHIQRWGVWLCDSIGTPLREEYGRVDYTNSNGKGSRGVLIWYTLNSGPIYLVKSPQSWKTIDVYKCYVTEDGNIVRK